jgi:hypothetical protein
MIPDDGMVLLKERAVNLLLVAKNQTQVSVIQS